MKPQSKKLNDVAEVKSGFAFKSSEYSKEGLPIIKISNITQGKNIEILSGKQHYYNLPLDDKQSKVLLKKGDILIALSGATTGKIGIYNDDKLALLNQRIALIRSKDKKSNDYVYYFLQTKSQQILKEAYGGAQPNISPNSLKEYEIYYPEKFEDRQQIVSAIETQFSRLDEVVENLRSVKRKLGVYRKAVLKKGFEKGEGWKEGTMKDTGEYINGRCFKKSEWRTEGIPIIRIQNLTGRNKNFNYFNGALDEKNKIKNGDLLLSWSATLDVFEWDRGEAALNQHIFKIIPKLDKKFLYYLLKTKIIELYSKTHGTGMMHITRTKFDKINVAFPKSIKEQQKIVAHIESKFSVIDKVEEAVEGALVKAESLRKSVLKVAFEGRLVR